MYALREVGNSSMGVEGGYGHGINTPILEF